jgi:hypothetical protein
LTVHLEDQLLAALVDDSDWPSTTDWPVGLGRGRRPGDWDRGQLDRGTIGLQLLTGRRPTLWNGRAAFLPAIPYHENHQIQLLPGRPAEAWPRDKAMVTLADAGADALALRHGEIWLGHITGRPDLVTYISRIVTAGLPPTARVRIQQGRLLAQLADQDATIVQLSRLGTHDLPAVRTPLAEPPPSGSPLVRPG